MGSRMFRRFGGSEGASAVLALCLVLTASGFIASLGATVCLAQVPAGEKAPSPDAADSSREALYLAPATTDSVPTLEGLFYVDLDSLLLAGQGVVLAFEDTFAVAPSGLDTLVVTAPRVTIGEVIEAIGRKMERDMFLLDSHAFTSLVTVVLRHDDTGGDYELLEQASRHRYDRDEGNRVAQLWKRNRKYDQGEMSEDEVDEEVTAEYLGLGDPIEGAMPFMPDSGDRYDYEILARDLVGNSLIYKIRFSPRSSFDALPSGVVWVDYSNWVIRKVEAEMTGTVPLPWILKSVPVYRMSRERFGNTWFTTDVYYEVELQKLPLLGLPRLVEVNVRLTDLEINGTAYTDDGQVAPDRAPIARLQSPVPVTPPPAAGTRSPAAGTQAAAGETESFRLQGGATVEPDTLDDDFLMSPEASADSLAAFWSALDEKWQERLSVEVAATQWDTAQVDSLRRLGDERLTALTEGSLWRLGFDLPAEPLFNRVQGPLAAARVKLALAGPNRPHLDLLAGYAFSNRRPVFGIKADVPLLRDNWLLPGRWGRGQRYTKVNLRLSGRKNAVAFAGDGRLSERTASALIYGSDPNHYFEQRDLFGALDLRLARGLTVSAGGGYTEQRSLDQRTDWNIFGRSLHPQGNRLIDDLDTRYAHLAAHWHWGDLHLDGQVQWHRVDGSAFVTGLPGAPDQADFRRAHVHAELDHQDGAGNQWLLRGGYQVVDRRAPGQWRTWLGDHGTLRGYRAGELSGDRGAWASLDLRLDFDLWRTLRVPVLKKLGLQPILFADWGWTRDQDGALSTGAVSQDPAVLLAGPGLAGVDPGTTDLGWGPGDQGWRADVGIGFGRRLDLPLFWGKPNLRFYAARAVGQGSGDEDWRFLVAFEP